MPRGDGTGPNGEGPMNKSGCCEGRGRERHNVKKPLGEQKKPHARQTDAGRPGARSENCGCTHEHTHEHSPAHNGENCECTHEHPHGHRHAHHGKCSHHHDE